MYVRTYIYTYMYVCTHIYTILVVRQLFLCGMVAGGGDKVVPHRRCFSESGNRVFLVIAVCAVFVRFVK